LKELAKKLDSKINIIDDCSYGLCSEDERMVQLYQRETKFADGTFPMGSTDQTFFTALGIPMY
jgi:hypothetical protein